MASQLSDVPPDGNGRMGNHLAALLMEGGGGGYGKVSLSEDELKVTEWMKIHWSRPQSGHNRGLKQV